MSASASIAGEISIASTSAPISAASVAITPLPQPISAMRQPGLTPSMVSAERAHQVDKLTDLGGIACDLEHKAFGGGVDHAGAECIRQPQRLDPVVAAAAHLDHGKLALDRASRQRHVDDAVDRDHAVELVLDLLDHHRCAGGDDGDAGKVFL